MKRLIVVLGGLLALPAFAEVSPFLYGDAYEYSDMEYLDDADEYADEVVTEQEEVVAKKPVASTKVSPRSTATRTGSRAVANTANVNTRRGNGASSRVVAARTTTSRTTAATPVRTTVSRGTVSRAAATSASNSSNRRVSTRRATSSNPAGVARATTGTVTVQTASGKTEAVFEDNNLYDGRVGIRSSANSRVPTIRVASATMKVNQSSVSNASVAETTAELDNLAELTDYCKAQYTACMDNFCNILDDNQGRCSCSKNIKNYEKTEQALKAATEELQDVAQKIQYIGLTGDEITTLFSETEAEETMRTKTDTSQLKASLDKIKDMIIDVRTGNTSGVSDSSMSFDLSNLLDFTISSTGFDLSALFGTSTSTSSINNQRGETLYKTATSRCKASVLNSCIAQGVDASVITNSYDLEIDKQCIAYERSLSDSNDQMTATVRNAKTVLQKARLMVAQQKNQYDLRGCVSALDACMQDDYVCGPDYESCLDPTGKYIVNGQIVVGSLPGRPLNYAVNNPGMFKTSLYETWCTDSSCSEFAWDYDGQTTGNLANYINDTLYSGTTYPKQTSTNMSQFLQYKIGYNDTKTGSKDVGKNFGMCMSVLNKCQNYTYDKDRKYKPDNNVISEYLYRAMIQIKAAQDAILSEYAESCIQDVSSCLSSNGYESATNKNIPVNACKAIIATCMSVNGDVRVEPTPREMLDWARDVYDGLIGASSDANTGGSDSGSGSSSSGSGTTTTTYYSITYQCGSGTTGTAPSAVTNITAGTSKTLATSAGSCSKSGYTFNGWDCGSGSITVNSNVVCTAQWSQTPSTTYYSITYQCGSGATGTAPSAVTNIIAGTSKTLATSAGSCSKSGYTFNGWDCGSGSITVNSNVVCTAQWTSTTSNIAHSVADSSCTGAVANETYGGCVAAGRKCETVYYVYNGTCRSPCADVDTTFGFANVDASCTSVSPYGTDNGCVAKYCRCSESYSSYVGSAGDWQKPACLFQNYTVSYECDNGSYSIEADTCKYGTTVTLKNVSVCGQKNGSNATGWDNGATTYLCEGNKTFTAQWGQPTNSYDYTITLNKNGGTGGTSTLYVKSGDGTYLDSNLNELYNHSCSSGDFVVPTKNNSTFVGYYSQQSGGTEYIDNGGCLTMEGYDVIDRHQNETWYARWEDSTPTTYYSITYQCGSGATGTAPSAVTNITAGTSKTLATSAGSCSKSGYTFNGWDCGSGSITVNNNVVCTAQWTQSGPAYDFTVTLNKNGGTGGTSTLYVKSGDGTYLDSNLNELYNHSCSSGDFVVPTKNNSTFVGYYSQQSGGTEYIDNGGCLTMEGYDVIDRHQNETWYARWATQATTTYDVTFNCNGGTQTSTFESPRTVNEGAIVTTLPATACNAPSTNRSFNGWKCGTKTYEASTTFAPDGDITCYASWELNSTVAYDWTITLDKNGGEGGPDALYASMDDGVCIDENCETVSIAPCDFGNIEVPEQSGQTFVGYYSQQTGGVLYLDDTGCLTDEGLAIYHDRQRNETWYAHWE